jgi:hypothetical protein
MSVLSRYPMLSQVIELTQNSSRQEPEFVRTKQADWHQELKAALADPAVIAEIISQMPEEPKGDAPGFWASLDRFIFLGGFGDPVEDFGCALAERMIATLPPERRPALLNQLNDRKASFFFSGGRWLKAVTIAENFPVEFVANWVAARFVAYGQDMAVGDLWRLLQKLSEEKPAYAFALALVPAFATTDDGRMFQIELLGSLRFRAGLPKVVSDALPTVLEQMKSSPGPTERAIYWRTFKRPLAEGRLPDEELERALAGVAGSPEELNVGFELAKSGARPPTPKTQIIRLLKWLAAHVEPPPSPAQQFDIATAVWLSVEHVSPEELGFDAADLLLQIQPVDPTYRGIWQQIESALFSLSRQQRPRVCRVLRSLAHRNWPALQKMLEPNAPLHGILTRLGEKPDDTAAFAADLTGSKSPGERRLGFYLTENLQLPAPLAPETAFSEEQFTVWLAEFRINMVYRTMAQQLMRASTRIDPGHAEMVNAFQQEVLYQCKNLPGLCLEEMKARRAEVPLIEKPVSEAEAYFAALQALEKSPVRAMQIPGLKPAVHRKRRIDAAKMEEAVAAHSILEQFVKKSYLLYGTRWVTFNGGVLGKESGLQSHSVGTEYPRKVFIDPEGTLLMSFAAQGDLRRLKPEEVEEPA